MKSLGGPWCNMTSILMNRGNRPRHTQWDSRVNTRVLLPQPRNQEGTKTDPPLLLSERAWVCWHLDLKFLSLQGYETILGLWHFILEALRKWIHSFFEGRQAAWREGPTVTQVETRAGAPEPFKSDGERRAALRRGCRLRDADRCSLPLGRLFRATRWPGLPCGDPGTCMSSVNLLQPERLQAKWWLSQLPCQHVNCTTSSMPRWPTDAEHWPLRLPGKADSESCPMAMRLCLCTPPKQTGLSITTSYCHNNVPQVPSIWRILLYLQKGSSLEVASQSTSR